MYGLVVRERKPPIALRFTLFNFGGASVNVFELLMIYSELLIIQGREKSPFLINVELAENYAGEFSSRPCDDWEEQQPPRTRGNLVIGTTRLTAGAMGPPANAQTYGIHT